MNPLFWLIAGAMIVTAVAFVAWGLLRGRRAGPTQQGADVAAYRQQRESLERDLETGQISQQAYQQASLEIDRQLLAEAEDMEEQPTGTAGRVISLWPLVATVVVVITVALSMYALVGGGTPARQAAQGNRAHANVAGMVQQLAQRLEAQPDDGQGWLMLARSYAAMDKPQQAVKAYSRAYQLLGDNPTLLLGYAEALAAARRQPSLVGRPAQLIKRALELAPQDPHALWLAGVVAASQGDVKTAVAHWQAALQQLPADDPNAAVIRRNLTVARQQLGTVTAVAPAKQPPPGVPVALQVHVTLADALKDKVRSSDIVYIFARAISGPPMPLAVEKRRVSDLPVTIVLDDGDSMLPGRGISSQKRVQIVARISKTGHAIARSGDLQSAAKTVPVATADTVSLRINARVP